MISPIKQIMPQNRNEYTIDVIYDDETNRILCNETLDYINNTKTVLSEIKENNKNTDSIYRCSFCIYMGNH